MKRTGDAD